MKPPPQPSFETEEQLRALYLEGVQSGEGTLMTPEEWHHLRDELLKSQRPEQRLAS